MSLSLTLNTAVAGMTGEANRLSAAARTVAMPEPAGDRETTEAMVEVIEAEIGYRANASVFETGATLWDLLLSVPKD